MNLNDLLPMVLFTSARPHDIRLLRRLLAFVARFRTVGAQSEILPLKSASFPRLSPYPITIFQILVLVSKIGIISAHFIVLVFAVVVVSAFITRFRAVRFELLLLPFKIAPRAGLLAHPEAVFGAFVSVPK